jgi:nucleoside-diphosphate-sugar epimerase
MKVLITGGTGLIGNAVVAALRARGHQLRILSRHADPDGHDDIEYWPASVADAAALAGAAAGIDVVLHIAGIVSESPPDLTFANVNVDGTRNIVREADISGVRRFVYVSSFGADVGNSDYHKSKLAAEGIARRFPRDVVITRPGNVYGPGDEVISALLKVVRVSPVVPVIDGGDQPFQPIWHEDVGAALAAIIEAAHTPRQPLNLLGPDQVTANGLLDMLSEITGQRPRRISLPGGLAALAARFAAAVGIDIPLKPDVLQMLLDSKPLPSNQTNALEQYVAQPTSIQSGLRQLLECLPEQDLDEGHGAPKHHRFTARIQQPVHGPNELFQRFCADYDRFLPVKRAEQQGNPRQLSEGETIALSLPLRGDISVRVEEAADNAVTLVTVDGHPLAGFVRFTWRPTDAGFTFQINAYDRPATLVDTIGMALGGSLAQRNAWITACETMVSESRGVAPDGVQHETEDLSEAEATRVQEWLDARAARS